MTLTGGLGRAVARAAVAIAVVTVLARLAGFLRGAVFARTVGFTCLGDTYSYANTIPNVVFEVVAGGALASLVVPLVAGAVASGDTGRADRTASALLSWTILLLVPVALAGVLLARPLMSALVGTPGEGCSRAAEVEVGARMLAAFAPQVVLYGVGLVVAGVLQAHRRFLGPALAPLLSSLVVVSAYLAYAGRTRRGTDLDTLSRGSELTLSVGTTLGVAVLSLSMLVPLRRAGVRLRPSLSFPPGGAARARSLATAGIAGLAAQQLAVLVALRLANGGPRGSVVVLTLALAVFLLPWAVLAVPVATSAFPLLSAYAESGDDDAYRRTMASTLRAVVLSMLGAAAVLVAVAGPAARVLVRDAPGRPSETLLADAVTALAPGLVGYGLLALVGRALYARGASRTSAVATVVGWLVVVATDLVLVAVLPSGSRVTALAVGNTAGMTVAGVLLLRALRREAGPPALAGLPRVVVGGSLAAAAAGGAGLLAARGLGPAGTAGSLARTALVAVLTLAVFGVLAAATVGSDLRALLRRETADV